MARSIPGACPDRSGGAESRRHLSVCGGALPVLVLGSWGGALADRLPARPTLIVLQTLRALLALALIFGTGHLWPIYAVALASGAISSIEGPCLGRFGSALVPPSALGSALALGSVLSSAGRILGMSLGGVLVGITGASSLFALNALSYGAVIVALAAMRPGSMRTLAAAAPGQGSIRAGLRYVARQAVLLVAGFTISLLQLAAGSAPTVLGFAAFLVPIAAGAVIFDTVVSTRIQLDTREDMRGRVLATVGIVSLFSGMVGAPAIGWLCDTLGAAVPGSRPAERFA